MAQPNTDPLAAGQPIANPDGTPTPLFLRQWATQRAVNQVSSLQVTDSNGSTLANLSSVITPNMSLGTQGSETTLNLNLATASSPGISQPDGTTITINDGILTSTSGGPPGATGATGAAGATGPTGVAGPTGPAGGSGTGSAPASSQLVGGTVTGPGSATFTMGGLAGSVTPSVSGIVLVIISGYLSLPGGAARGINLELRYGTGSAPANGGTVTGTQIGATSQLVTNAGLTGSLTQNIPFSIVGLITGATVGTALWLDVAQNFQTAGGCQVLASGIVAFEAPLGVGLSHPQVMTRVSLGY